MIAKLTNFDKLLAQIAGMNTIGESNVVRQAIQKVKLDAQPDEYKRVRLALSKRLNEIAEQGENELADANALIRK